MIRPWLRNWLGITRIEARKVLNDSEDPAMKRIALLEFELAKQEQQHAADITELRERLNNRVSRGTNPHRSFQMMRKVAEMGELAARSKNAG